MKKVALLFTTLFVCVALFSCSSRKLSSNYGDNKTYTDEDSVGVVKVKEKKTKMPFDTTAAPAQKMITNYETY